MFHIMILLWPNELFLSIKKLILEEFSDFGSNYEMLEQGREGRGGAVNSEKIRGQRSEVK